MRLDIVSKNGAIYSEQVNRFFAYTVNGELGILPQHAPLIAILAGGLVRVDADVPKKFYVSGGILEVQPYLATILADHVVCADSLDEAKVMLEVERAQQILEAKKSLREVAIAEYELEAAMVELTAVTEFKSELSKTGMIR
jgi:F-type H+-transporting ATPase subunit epsilon